MFFDPEIFRLCADRLETGRWQSRCGEVVMAATALFQSVNPGRDRQHNAGLARLMRVAAGLDAVFAMPLPAAPGLSMFGARVAKPASALAIGVNGIGFTPADAFARCIGEAAETLAVLSDGGPEKQTADQAADRRAGQPASEGCAAGPDLEAASEAALLELIERDALARWWYGGQTAARLGPAELAAAGFAELATASGFTAAPSMLFLRLGSDLPVSVIAACTVNASGLATAFGYAARPDLAAAVRAAFLEVVQSALALDLARVKMRHGGGSHDASNDHLARFISGVKLPEWIGYDASHWPHDGVGGLRGYSALLAACRRCGFAAERAELTQPEIGVPVVRMRSPDLLPSSFTIFHDRVRTAPDGSGRASLLSNTAIPLL